MCLQLEDVHRCLQGGGLGHGRQLIWGLWHAQGRRKTFWHPANASTASAGAGERCLVLI